MISYFFSTNVKCTVMTDDCIFIFIGWVSKQDLSYFGSVAAVCNLNNIEFHSRICGIESFARWEKFHLKLKVGRNALQTKLLANSISILKVAFFRKCDVFFKSPNRKKKYSKSEITILNLKFKFPANNSKQQIQISS